MPPGDRLQPPPAGLSTGLWTPSASSTPLLRPQAKELKEQKPAGLFTGPSSRKVSSGSERLSDLSTEATTPSTTASQLSMSDVEAMAEKPKDTVGDLAKAAPKAAQGLWGGKGKASGEAVVRRGRQEPKRRWTVDQE